MSNELPNLVLSTLSAGPVGVGDALDSIDAANLKRVMRADSVILKPDTPLVPIDAMYLSDATESGSQTQRPPMTPGKASGFGGAAGGQNQRPPNGYGFGGPFRPQTHHTPMVAVTASEFGGVDEHYVISFPRSPDQTGATVALHDLGINSAVYAWDWVRQTGETIPAGGSLQMQYSDGWNYEVLAPINQSGIALLGETEKIVPLARKRFSSINNGGQLDATVIFAPGEDFITVSGYSANVPAVRATTGRVEGFRYDPRTHLFHADIFAGGGRRARISISVGGTMAKQRQARVTPSSFEDRQRRMQHRLTGTDVMSG